VWTELYDDVVIEQHDAAVTTATTSRRSRLRWHFWCIASACEAMTMNVHAIGARAA